MRTTPVAAYPTSPLTRRAFLRTLIRPLAAGFTALADDLAWLMRWFAFGGAPRFAGAG